MSAYGLFIPFLFPFVSTFWRYCFVPSSFISIFFPVLSTSVSTLDLILLPHFSMLDSILAWFDLTLTTFPTMFLVEGGQIWRVSMCLYPITMPQNFTNKAPFSDFNPVFIKKVMYINILGVSCAQLLPVFLCLYWILIILEQYFLLYVISLWSHE